MTARLPRTETALADCREHFALCEQHLPSASFNPAIIAYLTRQIAVLLCAEVEIVVTQMIFARVDSCGDAHVAQFVRSVRGNIVRNAKFSEIGEKLGSLGMDYKECYEQEVTARVGIEGIAKLGMAVGRRDEFAHAVPPDVTFTEIEAAYFAAEGIIESVRIALALPVDYEPVR